MGRTSGGANEQEEHDQRTNVTGSLSVHIEPPCFPGPLNYTTKTSKENWLK